MIRTTKSDYFWTSQMRTESRTSSASDCTGASLPCGSFLITSPMDRVISWSSYFNCKTTNSVNASSLILHPFQTKTIMYFLRQWRTPTYRGILFPVPSTPKYVWRISKASSGLSDIPPFFLSWQSRRPSKACLCLSNGLYRTELGQK